MNEHLSTVTAYLVRGGDRFRLGDVEANATRRFYVSGLVVGSPDARVRLQAHDLESPYDSDPLWAEPGQSIVFRVGERVASSLRIR